MSYRFLIVNTDYVHFLRDMYQRNPGLSSKSFEEQYYARTKTLFGTNDFYSKNLRKLGHEAVDLICNNPFMQYAWAVENGLISKSAGITDPVASLPEEWLASIFQAQVKSFRPDIIVNMGMETVTSKILNEIKPDVRLIIGQHAAPLTQTMSDLSAYDLIISSLPNYVDYFKKQGKESIYLKLGFEASVLDEVDPCENRTIDVGFVGGFSGIHSIGKDIFNHLAESGIKMALYGYDEQDLSAKAKRYFHGAV